MKLVVLKSLSTGYNGTEILSKVNLEIHDRDFLGIIGPNGGGKTTLIKVILGSLRPYSGTIEFPGLKMGEKENFIGYLPQVQKFDPKFPISVRDVVLSGLMDPGKVVKRFTKAEKDKALRLLDEMGIFHLKDTPIGNLSGGQMQRVFLCRALVASPRLLILDEPSTYVDNQFESELYEKLKVLNEKMAIVLVSHDIGTISYYIKTIACVNRQLHYHKSNIITEKQLEAYNCPMQVITHGDVPHTVLRKHNH